MSPRRELVWIHDIAGAQSGVIGRDFLDLYTDTVLDQTETLTFEIPAAHPKAYLLAEDVEVRLRGRTFYVREITQERRGTETLVRVEANATWYRLGDQDFVGSLVLSDANVALGATSILASTGWTADPRTPATGSFSMETQDRSILANIRTWAKITGTFVEFDTQARTVAWLSARGADLGLAFRKGRNLRNVVRRRNPPKVTALLPYGRDDLSIAGVNGGDPSIEDASFYTAQGIDFDATAPDGRTYRQILGKRRVIRDQSFVKEADLLAWAQSKIATEAQSIQAVELDVADISEITGVNESLEVGDRCRAFDPDFDEEFSATVTRFVDYPLQPWRNAIELSTSPPVVADLDASSGRTQQSNEWILFQGPVSADFLIRNDSIWTVARIPLRFREGGRAHYHLDLWLTGVDDGTATVTVYENEAAENVRETLTVGYVDGVRSRVHLTWSSEGLEGRKDYRIRVTTEASGGASSAKGVDVDIEDDGSASFYVLAQGAVQETPVETNSVTFNYTGAIQQWTVPDNVTGPVTILAEGSRGGGSASNAGKGSSVQATIPAVISGQVFDVYVGGGTLSGSSGGGSEVDAGWPNGGLGGTRAPSGSHGGGGGGASFVCPVSGSIADALVVASGGGGAAAGKTGGDGGFFLGEDGQAGSAGAGLGATQFTGGAGGALSAIGGPAGTDGTAGSFGQGGAGGDGGSLLGNGGGGGGGGWYGGGGGGSTSTVNGSGPGGGGGGSGWTRSDAVDIVVQDGVIDSNNGRVVISWELPA